MILALSQPLKIFLRAVSVAVFGRLPTNNIEVGSLLPLLLLAVKRRPSENITNVTVTPGTLE